MKKKTLSLAILTALTALLFVPSLAEAQRFNTVTVFGDTQHKTVRLSGDTPAVKFGDGSDTYQLFLQSSGKFLLEYEGDTDILEADTAGNVVIKAGQLDMSGSRIVAVAEPTSDSDAATKNYVDNTAGGSGNLSSGPTFDTGHVGIITGSDTVETDTGLPYDTSTNNLGVSDGTDTTTYIGDGSQLNGISGDTDVTVYDSGTLIGDFGIFDFNSNLTVTQNGTP